MDGLLLAIAILGGIIYIARRQAARRPRHDRPGEIDAEWGQGYRGPGRKGEPFFAPGGLMLILSMVAMGLLAAWLRGYIEPIADWLVPGGRPVR